MPAAQLTATVTSSRAVGIVWRAIWSVSLPTAILPSGGNELLGGGVRCHGAV